MQSHTYNSRLLFVQNPSHRQPNHLSHITQLEKHWNANPTQPQLSPTLPVPQLQQQNSGQQQPQARQAARQQQGQSTQQKASANVNSIVAARDAANKIQINNHAPEIGNLDVNGNKNGCMDAKVRSVMNYIHKEMRKKQQNVKPIHVNSPLQLQNIKGNRYTLKSLIHLPIEDTLCTYKSLCCRGKN